MSFPNLIDAGGSSLGLGNSLGGVFFHGTMAYAFAVYGVPNSVQVFSSPDGVTWTLTDAAGHPTIGDSFGGAFFRVVQNTTNNHLFYVVLIGSDNA